MAVDVFRETQKALERYKKVKFLGSGAYAEVFEYERLCDHARVAIKLVSRERYENGLNLGAVKEIQALQELRHPNIVKLEDVFPYNDRLAMVLEHCDRELSDLIEGKAGTLRAADVKALLYDALLGLQHMHASWTLHRDLKPENMLLGHDGRLKIADLGLALLFGTIERKMFPKVATLWYRSPEILFGSKHYGPALDIWSMGCIFGEMVAGTPLFPGAPESPQTEDVTQLGAIFRLMGTPVADSWPGVQHLPKYVEFVSKPAADLGALLPSLSDDGVDLLRRMLCLNPADRITAAEALQHPYFSDKSPPTRSTPEEIITRYRRPLESPSSSP